MRESGSGNFAGSGETGTKEVRISSSGKAAFTVETMDDATDEADGAITAAVAASDGYTLPKTKTSAAVTIRDGDGR